MAELKQEIRRETTVLGEHLSAMQAKVEAREAAIQATDKRLTAQGDRSTGLEAQLLEMRLRLEEAKDRDRRTAIRIKVSPETGDTNS